MTWRPVGLVMTALVVSGLVVWFSPELLARIGLGQFAFLGQLCLTILALSALDALFRRIS